MSVWEPPTPVPSWRATANGLEGGAAAHNSILLVADELHQLSPREAGEAALMLCNGLGKARADQRGEARARKHWTIMVLSSGECSLADRIAAAGETVTPGQEVRFLDIKVDERAFGCFDDLHSETGGKAFAEHLADASCAAYGAAGPAFVEFIMRTPDIVSRAEAIMAKFEAGASADYGLADANAQVTRALRRFAIIAAGGELATEAGDHRLGGGRSGRRDPGGVRPVDSRPRRPDVGRGPQRGREHPGVPDQERGAISQTHPRRQGRADVVRA